MWRSTRGAWRRRCKPCSAALAVVLLTAGACLDLVSAQDGAPQWQARVRVVVDYKGDQKYPLESCLNRELRRLPGVQLVFTDEDYRLTILGFEPRGGRGDPLGYAFSFLATEVYRVDTMEAAGKAMKADSAFLSLLAMSTDGLERIRHYVTLVGPAEALDSRCVKLVAQFDVETLEPSRKAWQAVKDLNLPQGGLEDAVRRSLKDR